MFRVLVLVILIQALARPQPDSVWPKTQWQSKETVYYTFRPQGFNIIVKNYNCSLLYRAYNRLLDVCHKLYEIAFWHRDLNKRKVDKYAAKVYNNSNRGYINSLTVNLMNPCELLPHPNMEESYELKVARDSWLTSDSIWGIIRGLETMAQLFFISEMYYEVYIHKNHIEDYPRFKHRGLLLDTSRHYISVENILTTLEAMAINKMNVFHWHIVDDQSFPYVSEKLPELSEKGAFYPTMVYTKETIKTIIEYATDRGIRVIPEFDMPGHTLSWGKAYPEFISKCYNDDEVVGTGPFDPTSEQLYDMLSDLFEELKDVFPDEQFHLGGDEVDFNCWIYNPAIRSFWIQHKLTKVNELFQLFMNRTLELLPVKKIIVWQEVYDNEVSIPQSTLIQVWKSHWEKEISDLIKAGFKVIFSSDWYLDNSLNTFEKLYHSDPRRSLSKLQVKSIVGGEACMWSELVDDVNVISWVWPRASAIAEVLWSPYKSRTTLPLPRSVTRRIEEVTCHMRRRNISAASPIGPGYCLI